MPIIKIRVDQDLNVLRDSAQRMVDDFFHVSVPMVVLGRGWVPAVDIYETPEAVYVVADMAGVDKEDLHVTIEGRHLQVAGRRHPPTGHAERQFYQMEIEYGPFERIVRLPEAIESEHVEAQYEDGLLVVRLLREKPRETVRISVK